MSPGTRALVEEATGVVCTEAKLDPRSSLAIDEMQARPSLPVQTPEARAGAARAQRLLPLAKNLVIQFAEAAVIDYKFQNARGLNARIQQGIERVQGVRTVRPDMDSRDNASVFLSRPHTITFGTIFLAGLRSDEGMISVLSHELMHIADGDRDSLRVLVSAVGSRASRPYWNGYSRATERRTDMRFDRRYGGSRLRFRHARLRINFPEIIAFD